MTALEERAQNLLAVARHVHGGALAVTIREAAPDTSGMDKPTVWVVTIDGVPRVEATDWESAPQPDPPRDPGPLGLVSPTATVPDLEAVLEECTRPLAGAIEQLAQARPGDMSGLVATAREVTSTILAALGAAAMPDLAAAMRPAWPAWPLVETVAVDVDMTKHDHQLRVEGWLDEAGAPLACPLGWHSLPPRWQGGYSSWSSGLWHCHDSPTRDTAGWAQNEWSRAMINAGKHLTSARGHGLAA